MPRYMTVKDLAQLFVTTEKTIRRWIDEDRDITFDGMNYRPEKDPGGNWLFVVTVIAAPQSTDEYPRKPVPAMRLRRRVLSPGIK